MKKLFFLLATCSVFGAESYNDLVKGVDFTGRSALSPTALNQLVDNARFNTNRGIVLMQPTQPDTVTNPRFTNFIWLDNSTAGLIQLKVYNGSSWTNVYLGSILTETNIADGAITTPKLASGAVSAEKILNGAVGSLQIAGSGVTADKIAVGVVNRSHLSDNLISTAQITNSAVTGAKIADGTLTSEKITTVNAVAITNLSDYVLSLNSNLSITKLPQPSGNNSNYTLITGPNSLTWTTAPIAEVITLYPWAGTYHGGVGYNQTATHALGRKPLLISAVFEITNTIHGYTPGEEINLTSLSVSNGTTARFQPFGYGFTATGITLRCDHQFWSNGASPWVLLNATNGTETKVGGVFFPTNLGAFKFYIR